MEQYKYYSTHRPVDIGTFPKPAGNPPVEFVNFDRREAVEHDTFMAWGYLLYEKPLTAEEMYNYELRPSRKNMDVRRAMDAQAQVVGAWEVRNHIPEVKRLTWYSTDFGSFVPGDTVTPEQLENQHDIAVEFPKVPPRFGRRKAPPTQER